MNESDTGEGQPRLPAQQAQQPQPAARLNDQAYPLQMNASKDSGSDSGNAKGGMKELGNSNLNPAFDNARFTAGVAKLYEALLKEPIPEEMIRLVNELGKQERK